MSMYTQLLEAAFGQRTAPAAGATEQSAGSKRCSVAAASCRRGTHPDTDPHAVPVALALQIAYDVALIDLAGTVGIDTDPSRFEQPQQERERIERALHELGYSLESVTDAEEPVTECS